MRNNYANIIVLILVQDESVSTIYINLYYYNAQKYIMLYSYSVHISIIRIAQSASVEDPRVTRLVFCYDYVPRHANTLTLTLRKPVFIAEKFYVFIPRPGRFIIDIIIFYRVILLRCLGTMWYRYKIIVMSEA